MPRTSARDKAAPPRITFQQHAQPEEAQVESAAGADTFAPDYDIDQERAFEEIRRSSDQEAEGLKLWVYQVPTDERGIPLPRSKHEHLFTVPVDRYSLDELLDVVRREYMARERDAKRWCVRIICRDDREVRLNRIFVVRRAPGMAGEGAGAGAGGITLDQVRELLDASNRRTDELLARLSRPPEQRFDFGRLLSPEMITAGAALLAALRGGGGGAPSISDMIDGMAKLQRMSGTSSRGGSDEGGVTDTLRAIAPMGTEFLGLLRDAARGRQQIPPMISAGPPRLPAPVSAAAPGQPGIPVPTAQPAAPAAAAPMAVTPTAPAAATEESQVLNLMRAQLETLAQVATENPSLEAARNCVPLVMQAIPEAYDDQFYRLIEGEGWFGQLSMLAPAIKPHAAWFAELRKGLLAAYDDEGQGAPG